MELNAHRPAVIRPFAGFDKLAVRCCRTHDEVMSFELGPYIVVHLIAVAVTLAYVLGFICGSDIRTLFCNRIVGAKPHGPAVVFDLGLLFQKTDHRVRR